MHFFSSHSTHRIGWAILIAAALLRLAGIAYGLPLWAVGDEPSSIFGALKMIELKTLIPALHADDFALTLHYSPVLSYLYLLLFVPVLCIQYLSFPGSLSLLLYDVNIDFSVFSHVAALDLSWLFITARLFSVLAGTATVWFVWKAGEHIFNNRNVGLFSAVFLAFSLLHVNYSHWARHWVPVTACFAAVIYFLSRRDFSIEKRYMIALIITGIGTSINIQASFGLLYAFLWYALVDKGPLIRIWKERWAWKAIAFFMLPVLLAYAAWPAGFGYLSDTTPVREGYLSMSNWIDNFIEYETKLLMAEPIFFLFFCFGCVAAFKQCRNQLFAMLGCSVLFVSALYVKGLAVDRGLLLVYPLMAICAGYGLFAAHELLKKVRIVACVFLCVILSLVLIPTIKFDILLMRNDTRELARQWMIREMPRNARVLVLASLLDVPAVPDAIMEQEMLDPASLRSLDRASRAIGDRSLNTPRFYALHLHRVPYRGNEDAFGLLDMSSYDYFIISSGFAAKEGYTPFVDRAGGENVATFFGSFREDALHESFEPFPEGFQGGIPDLFRITSFGPEILIRKL